MDQLLINETLKSDFKHFDVGLICSTSNQIIIGNPLHKIGYGNLAIRNVKAMKYREIINAIKLNSVKRFVAYASNSLAIYDFEREIAVRQFHEHDGSVVDVAWHRTSPYQLASVSRDDCTLRTWDVRSHPAQTSIRRSQRPFSRVQYSPDCSFVACSGESISIFDLTASQSIVQIGCSSYVAEIAFNPAECLLASASEDRLVRFWDVDTGECVTQSLPFESVVQRLEFHPDGKYLICATSQQLSAVIWEPFDLLFQTPKINLTNINELSDGKIWKTLDFTICDEELLQLNALSNLSQTSLMPHNPNYRSEQSIDSLVSTRVLLTSKSFLEFEKCTPKSINSIWCGNNLLTKEKQQSSNFIPKQQSSSNISDVSLLRLTSSPQNSSQIPRPTQILSATHDFISNTALSSSPLISPTLNSLSSPIADDLANSLNSSFTSNLILPDEINEEDNFSGSNESGSGEGHTSVTSFASSNDKEDINSKFSSPRILTPVSMSQIKSNKSLKIIRRMRSPNNISNSSSPISSVLESLHSSPKKHQLASQNSNIPSNNSNNKYLMKQQIRSKSCNVSKTPLIEQKSSTISGNSKPTIVSTSRRKSTATVNNVVKPKKNDNTKLLKLVEILKSGERICLLAKQRSKDLDNFLHQIDFSHLTNICEEMVDLAAKQDDLRVFSLLLKSYLEHPKSYCLSLNNKFLDKIRNLFAHQNASYLTLALDLLEMVVQSFGDSIRHGLAAKTYSIGVDVVAEQRFERCSRCRNSLLEVQLNSPFLIDRLNDEQKTTFKVILSQIDRILE